MKIDQNRTFFIVTLYKIIDFEAFEIGKIQLIHSSHLQAKSSFYFSGSFCFYLQAKSFLFVRKFLTQSMWTKMEASCLKNSCVWAYLDQFFSEKNQNIFSFKIFQFSIWYLGPWSPNDQFEQGGNTAVHGGDIEVEPMSPHVQCTWTTSNFKINQLL